MKVNIGKYTTWIGPYQVIDWFKPIFGEKSIDKFTNSDFFDKWSEKVMPFFIWIESKKKRKIKIVIHNYDTWGMDDTLSLIIVPMLKQLRDTKHGSPLVDDIDVPESIRSHISPNPEDEYMDNNFHTRWKWVLDEMIWAHEAIISQDNMYDKEINERIQNGLELFGKYYRGLWD